MSEHSLPPGDDRPPMVRGRQLWLTLGGLVLIVAVGAAWLAYDIWRQANRPPASSSPHPTSQPDVNRKEPAND